MGLLLVVAVRCLRHGADALLTRTKDSAKDLAARLGTSRRWSANRAGKLTKPQKRLRAALVEATESEWQPQARAQARE
jgi:hypothetical protein